jgi:hypothetical protein
MTSVLAPPTPKDASLNTGEAVAAVAARTQASSLIFCPDLH